MSIDNGCLCHEVENPWTYHGIVEPGGAMEPNPDCEVHFPKVPKRAIAGAARIKVVDGATTSFLIAERVLRGWQSGVMHYPDAIVVAVSPVVVTDLDEFEEQLSKRLAKVWDEGRECGVKSPYGKRGLGTDDNPYRSRNAE